MKESQYNRLARTLSSLSVKEGEMLAEHTTIKVGGAARFFIEITKEQDVVDALHAARQSGVPYMALGNGSNMLFADDGYQGVILHFGRAFSTITVEGLTIKAQSGAMLSRLSSIAAGAELKGLEFAASIPGTVGGAAVMNAGAFGSSLADYITRVRCLMPDLSILNIPVQEMDYAYRHSRAMAEGLIILEVEFLLQEGEGEAIRALMKDYSDRRRANQPLTYPSAGSFFKRPEGHFAGALIESAGLKGLKVGQAQVSEKHAGFLINLGGATAEDFVLLSKRVQQTIEEQFCVMLEPEVRILHQV